MKLNRNHAFSSLIAGTILLSILNVVSLNIPIWITQGSGKYEWQGGLLSKSNTFYINYHCNLKDQSFCLGLYTLWTAGVVLLSLTILTLLSNSYQVLTLLKAINDYKTNEKLLTGLASLSFISQLTGYLFWLIYGKVSFSSCDRTFYDESNSQVCVSHGAWVSLFVLFGYCLELAGVILSLNWNEIKQKLTSGEDPAENKEIQPENIVINIIET